MLEVRKAVVGIAIDEEGQATPGSRRAVQRAIVFAKATGTHLELLHAAPWMVVNSPEAPRTPRERKERERQARDVLQEIETDLQSEGIESSSILVPRTPARALSRAARDRASDLVIVGRRNMRSPSESKSLQRMGSVARELVQICPAPVWVVKASFVSNGKSVLATTDLDPIGVEILAWAHTFSRALQSELHVLHTWQRPFCSQWESRMSDEDLLIQFQRDAEIAVERQVADAEADRASLHVGTGPPLRAIREGAANLRPELIVLGSVSRRGLPGVVIGNTVQRILDQIECSLLVLKPDAVSARLAELDPVR